MSGAANWNDYQPPGGSVLLTWDTLTNSNPNGAGPLVRPTWAQVFGSCIINFPYVLTVSGGAMADGFLHTVQIGGVDTILSLSNTNLQVGGGIVYGGTIRSNISNKFSLDTAGGMSVQTLTINNLPVTDPVVSNKVYIWNGLLAISDGGTTIPSAPVVADNVLAVSAANGSDSTGARGRLDRPFKTPLAAQTAAQGGDTIVVYPGTYTVAASLAGKDAVNWFLHPGAVLQATHKYVFNITAAVTFAIRGSGDIVGTSGTDPSTDGGAILVNNASVVLSVEARLLRNLADDPGEALSTTTGGAFKQMTAARVYLNCDEISSNGGYCFWWFAGDCFVTAKRIFIDEGSTHSNGPTIVSQSSGAGQKLWVNADEIFQGDSTAPNPAIDVGQSSSATSAVWVYAKEIRSYTGSGNGAVVFRGGKGYVIASGKIFAQQAGAYGVLVVGASTLAYVTTQKIEAATALQLQAGTSWADVGEHNDGGLSGTAVVCSGGTHRVNLMTSRRTAAGDLVSVSGGVLNLHGAELVANAGNGVSHSGGTARLKGCRIDASAVGNAAKNPVTVSGSGLVLDGCVLLANGSRESVTAAAAKTVTNYGSVANTAKSANVTVNVQALTVDANVL